MKKKKIIISLSIFIILIILILNNFNEISRFKKTITQNPWEYEIRKTYETENGIYAFFENGKMIEFNSQDGTIKHGLYTLRRDITGLSRFWSDSENIIVEITLPDNEETTEDLIITYNKNNEIHGVFIISAENGEIKNLIDVTLTEIN